MITASSIATVLFFGGWHGPFVDQIPLLGPVYFGAKVTAIMFFFLWVRWTFPRLRYDQLMAFGWKILLPLSLLNVVVTAIARYWFMNR
jgi:NADH-quinone oxidoreductase subunit H